MDRRAFITLIGGGTTAWSFAAHAQQTERVQRIGVLLSYAESDQDGQSFLAAFRGELRKLGWAEGSHSKIDIRWSAGDVELMKQLAKELVALQPDLIFTSSTPAVAAILQQTRTIPIVFVFVADPVGSGFVQSLSQPGGNVTGFTPFVRSLGGKWVELLKEIAPGTNRITLIFNPPTATFVEGYLDPFKAAVASLGAEAIVAPVNDMPGLESLINKEANEPNSGIVVIPDSFHLRHRAQMTALIARNRVPTVYWSRQFTVTGGLISYGPYIVDEYRRAAAYANRILKGAKPSELSARRQSSSSW
jgi:putative ABC transport system substrate-binding protein